MDDSQPRRESESSLPEYDPEWEKNKDDVDEDPPSYETAILFNPNGGSAQQAELLD